MKTATEIGKTYPLQEEGKIFCSYYIQYEKYVSFGRKDNDKWTSRKVRKIKGREYIYFEGENIDITDYIF